MTPLLWFMITFSTSWRTQKKSCQCNHDSHTESPLPQVSVIIVYQLTETDPLLWYRTNNASRQSCETVLLSQTLYQKTAPNIPTAHYNKTKQSLEEYHYCHQPYPWLLMTVLTPGFWTVNSASLTSWREIRYTHTHTHKFSCVKRQGVWCRTQSRRGYFP